MPWAWLTWPSSCSSRPTRSQVLRWIHRATWHASTPAYLSELTGRCAGYPTKADAAYWGVLLSHYGAQDMVLLDDSNTNLRVAREKHGIRGIKVRAWAGGRLTSSPWLCAHEANLPSLLSGA